MSAVSLCSLQLSSSSHLTDEILSNDREGNDGIEVDRNQTKIFASKSRIWETITLNSNSKNEQMMKKGENNITDSDE